MKIYIAEDEPLAAAKLKLFLEKSGKGEDITLFSDGSKLIDTLLAGNKPDLLFMDIQMPHLTGLDILQKLPDIFKQPSTTLSFPIILTTAYDKYAIDGFNYGVTDYLLKPYTLERLQQSLQKAQLFLDAQKSQKSANEEDSAFSTSITVRSDGRNELVELESIECLEALKDYTCLHLSDGRKIMTLGTLTSFEQQLPQSQFIRVQRSYVINVRKVQSYSSQSLRLTSGIEVPIGKTYKDIITEFLH